MSEEVKVSVLPHCDLCQVSRAIRVPDVAYADCLVPSLGTWANVCRKHFILHKCRLGTGRGQRLALTS
jgi:hypothetical protein